MFRRKAPYDFPAMSSLPLGYSIDGEYEKAVEKGFEDFPRAPVDKPFSYGTRYLRPFGPPGEY